MSTRSLHRKSLSAERTAVFYRHGFKKGLASAENELNDCVSHRYRISTKKIMNSNELMRKAHESLVAADLRRLSLEQTGKLPSSESLMRLYSQLESRYESLLLRHSALGAERRLTMGKLAVVCRHLGKIVEAAQLEDQCNTNSQPPAGSAGFWSLFGY